MSGSVTVHINASPERVWEFVSDVTQIGRFSPETFGAEWLDGATGPAVGAKFRGHVRRNGWWPPYWVPCTVTVSEPGREFTFAVNPGGKMLNQWGYKLEPSGDGVDVTESFQLTKTPLMQLYWTLLGPFRGRTNRQDMRKTLERIKVVAESPAS